MTQQARVVVLCPHCGAPLPEAAAKGAATCPFCGVSSVPAPAPVVERPVTVTLVKKVARPDEDPEETGNGGCPVCDLPLFRADVDGVSLQGCGRCGGVWLDNASAKLALSLDDRTAVDALALRAARCGIAVQRPLVLTCPDCGHPLDPMNTQGVELDVCAAHGTWFDRFELGLVLQLRGKPPVVAPTTYGGTIPDFHAPSPSSSGDGSAAIVAGAALHLAAAVLAAIPDPPRD